ncbi:glycine cleavage system protein GcvH [Desulfosporosinus sp.]|uniref:glycine cleavage system protein GcvH n=1 Tax=Desulfosporosinus sp. TaxID=157907 RepID=UPI00232527DD|nr:glycine cleavage system protein GcvH [Desulfosporosinus sp.]MCO5385993.1 glycine cleavage system protein GcvH [Desulfosporosinus sp.]MDA8223629.1 glycine cleavage system protein GcvH [Desulfitobacterium hafniense]
MKMYSKEHQWVQLEGETARIGITEYAAKQLGDIVFVELPSVGDQFSVGEAMARVESVKSSSEIYTPVSGNVLTIKEELSDVPELLNSDPEGEAWVAELKLRNTAELGDLMTKEEYLASLSD